MNLPAVPAAGAVAHGQPSLAGSRVAEGSAALKETRPAVWPVSRDWSAELAIILATLARANPVTGTYNAGARTVGGLV